MNLKEIWTNRSWRFMFWLTAALLAYRTSPDAGFPLALSAATGALYLVMWVLLLHLDAKAGEKVSPVMKFMLVLMALMAVTLAAGSAGRVLTTTALLWLVPVGMPLQGLVRLVSAEASRSDRAMAVVSLAVLAALLLLRMLWRQKAVRSDKN